MSDNKDQLVASFFERNGVKSSLDYLMLSRNLATTPRCHTLNMTRRPTIGEHLINLLFLVDFTFQQKWINPLPDWVEITLLKHYLQYHDVNETILGDIPFYVEREIDRRLVDGTKETIMAHFTPVIDVPPDIKDLASQFDMVDFLMNIQNDPMFNMDTFDGRRLRHCNYNGVSMLLAPPPEVRKFQLEWQKLVRGY